MPGTIVFEDFELDEQTFELRRAGEPVRVQPKVLRLLFFLVQHRERSVSTQELLDALWPGERVTVASIKRAVGGARRALGESAESQSSIRTVRGHGYRFVRALEVARPAAPPTPTSDFVGREGVLARLDECLLQARAGRGQLVLVSGEPGIGKSRLLQELERRAAHGGAHAWSGRCTDEEGAPALWPFLQILRAAAAELGPASVLHAMGPGAADIAAAMPELRALYPQIAAPPEIGSTAARFRFFDSMLRCLERLAGRRPVCLIADDVQYADALTLALLTFIGRHVDRGRLLVIASLRASAKQAAHDGSPLAELLQLSTSTDVELTGLGPDELAVWIAQRSGTPAASRVVRHLYEQTAGNPLFVERLLHAAPAAVLPPSAAGHGLQRAIEQHVASLSHDTRGCLRVATVLGREFAVAVLAELLDAPAAQIIQQLAAAVTTGLLRVAHAHPGSYAFAHALIRDALYAQLPAEEAARLHSRAARVLEARDDGSELLLAQIADHELRAAPHHDPVRAIGAARRAAEAALGRAAYEEAAALFERAGRVLELGAFDPRLKLELLIAEGEALAQAGGAQARDALCRAAAGARTLGEPEVLVRVAMAFAHVPETGSVDATRLALLEQAIGACADEDPRKACLEALQAKALTYSRDRAACTRLARCALRRAETLSEPGLRAQTLIACWHGLAEPDCLPERRQIGEALARIGHEHSDCRALAWSAQTRVACALELGDLGALEAGIATLDTLAERARDPLARWHSLIFRATRCTLAAQLTEAADWAEQAYSHGLRLGPIVARHVYCTQLSAVRRLQGRLAEAEGLVREVSLSHPSIAGWQAVLAGLEAQRGQTEQPRKVLERLVEHDLAALRADPFALSVIAATADLCLLVGDAAHARPIYDALRPYEKRHGSISIGIGSHGPLARHLGRLALQLHEIDLAERHFEEAVAMAEAMPSPLFTSFSLLGYAHLLLVARSRSGARAEAMIARARELGRAHDLEVVVQYAQGLGALARRGPAMAATAKR